MPVEIQRTVVSSEANGGSVVELQISDVPPPYEDATTLLQMTVRLPAYEPPLLAHLQSEAIRVALRELRTIDQSLLREIGRDIHNDPQPKPRQSQS